MFIGVFYCIVQHELKLDAPIQKHVVSTLRCFERALQLDDASSKLWIEYGSCAYLIHSHSSRLLKQVCLFTLPRLNTRLDTFLLISLINAVQHYLDCFTQTVCIWKACGLYLAGGTFHFPPEYSVPKQYMNDELLVAVIVHLFQTAYPTSE